MPRRILRRLRRLLGRSAGDPSGKRRAASTPRHLGHASVRARRLRFEHLPAVPECPPGWRTGPPDFVILGAQKSGTTWWFWMIEQHPGVTQPRDQRPELHFFDRLWQTWPDQEQIAAYHSYFPRPEGKLIGEKTPEYLSCAWAPSMLAVAAPDARAIVLLRDPVERFISGLSHYDRSGMLSDDLEDGRYLGDRVRVVTDAIARGRYASQLEWLEEAFSRERTLVLQYERCVLDSVGQLARTYEFLGLPPHRPPDHELSRLRNEAKLDKVTMPREHLDLLARYYRPEVERLRERVPDLDLALWPWFRDLA